MSVSATDISAPPPPAGPSADAGPGEEHDPELAPPAPARDAAHAAAFAAHDPANHTELVIRPRPGWIAIDWKELWKYRELLYFLVWRDVKVRYKQAILGFAWQILAPLISVAIFTLVFGHAGGFSRELPPELRSEALGYPIFIYVGLIPWLMLSAAMNNGGGSLISQQNLLTKIYMPRLFIPAAVLGSGLVDMAVNMVVLAGMFLIVGVMPAWTAIALPVLIALTVMMGLGFAFTLSAMTVTYRDLRLLIPFIVQVFMLISAVAFPSTVLHKYPQVIYLNPIAGLISAWRVALFEGWTMGTGPADHLHPAHFAYTVLFALGLLAYGMFYFRKTERRFADIA